MSTDSNETADLIRDALGPHLGEFLDGYVLAGTKAGTKKKIIVINLKDSPTMMPMIKAAEEWGGTSLSDVKWMLEWNSDQRQFHISRVGDTHRIAKGATPLRDGPQLAKVEGEDENWRTLGFCDTYEEVAQWANGLREVLGAANYYCEEP